jgi:hypothetical protein
MLQKGNVFDKVILVLGPSKRLELRRGIKARLCDNQYGYPHDNIIIMEDVNGDDDLVISKFGNILDKNSPQLFFALLESDIDIEDMSGVIFELGWLCGKYYRREIGERLRIIADFDFQWRKTTRYVQSLIQSSSSQLLLINQMDVELISDSIHNNVTVSINVYNKNSRCYGTSSMKA